MTAARERAVRVVAEALIRHQRIPMFDDTQGQRCVGCDHLLGATDGPNSSRHAEHQAEAVVAAMEAEMGLREEATVDFCESQHRDRDGEWHYCKLPGDHESDHESDWVGSWPWDDVDGPRKKRTHRLVTDWMDDEGDNT